MTKIGWYTIGTSTILESNKSLVGIDAQLTIRELALEIEHVPGSTWRKGDAPEARLGRIPYSVI